MNLQEQLRLDLRISMKNKDIPTRDTIRVIMGDMARSPKKELSDKEVISIIRKLVKNEMEFLESTNNSSSPFLRAANRYLPTLVTDEVLFKWINDNIDFSLFKNKMQAMKPIMEHFGINVNGNDVKKILEKF